MWIQKLHSQAGGILLLDYSGGQKLIISVQIVFFLADFLLEIPRSSAAKEEAIDKTTVE